MRVLFILLFTGLVLVSSGQIQNTSWIGEYNLPEPTEASMIFGADTATLSSEEGQLLERMTFRINGDTLFLKKESGLSPCSLENEASYIISFKENKLFLLPVKDDCDLRRNSFPTEGLTKVKP